MFDANTQHPLLTLTALSSTMALSRVLREAARMRLGAYLAESPRTLTETAEHFGFREHLLEMLLEILVHQGLLIETDREYHANEYTRELDTLDQLFVGMENWHCWTALDDSLRTGEPAFDRLYETDFFSYLEQHPTKQANWERWNTVMAREGLKGVIPSLPVRDGQSVCDIGGGSGELLRQLLDYFPDCRGTLLERPGIEVAKNAPFELVSGDMFSSIPTGHDVYILSRVLCNWDDEHVLDLLRDIAAAMPPKGRLFIIDGVMPKKGDPGRGAYIGNSLNLFLMFGSLIRERRQFKRLLKKAGLKLHTSEPLETDTGIPWTLLVAKAR